MAQQFHLSVRRPRDRSLVEERLKEIQWLMDRLNSLYGEQRKWQAVDTLEQRLNDGLAHLRQQFLQRQEAMVYLDPQRYDTLVGRWQAFVTARRRPPGWCCLGTTALNAHQAVLSLYDWPDLVILHPPTTSVSVQGFGLQNGWLTGLYRLCLFRQP